MEALKVLADDIRDNNELDKEVMASIWEICHLARSWAIYPEGMLQENNFISKEQVEQLEQWVDSISYSTFLILDGCDNETAFEFYNE